VDKKDSESLIASLKNYLTLLETPRTEYEGLPTCPFIKKERLNNNLMIGIFNPEKESFLEKMETFVNSNFTDAVFAQQIDEKLSTEDSKTYQNFLNKLLREHYQNYKVIITNPSDNFFVKDYNPRSHAPCFLIVVTDRKKLAKAHKQMMNSKYFTNFGDDYLKYLNVKREDLNLK
tara:strand:- start:1653 stop:2177 length:525 start_codon:yes stop_codon:yes gene_type:complete